MLQGRLKLYTINRENLQISGMGRLLKGFKGYFRNFRHVVFHADQLIFYSGDFASAIERLMPKQLSNLYSKLRVSMHLFCP